VDQARMFSMRAVNTQGRVFILKHHKLMSSTEKGSRTRRRRYLRQQLCHPVWRARPSDHLVDIALVQYGTPGRNDRFQSTSGRSIATLHSLWGLVSHSPASWDGVDGGWGTVSTLPDLDARH